MDSNEYEEIDGCDDGQGDYDWCEFKVLREKSTGQLYAGYNSGCSCSWFWDEPDLVPVNNWQEAVEIAKSHVENGWGLSENLVFEMANRLAQR